MTEVFLVTLSGEFELWPTSDSDTTDAVSMVVLGHEYKRVDNETREVNGERVPVLREVKSRAVRRKSGL